MLRASSGKIASRSRKGWAINSSVLISELNEEQKQNLIDSLSAVINPQRQLLLQNVLSQRTRHLSVVLEDIYQAQNASAVIRSAECMGVQEIHIIENTHAYQINPAVVQGASKWMDIHRYKDETGENTSACLNSLKERGYKLVAMTLREQSRSLDQLELEEPLALCFGSEEPGLSELAHEMADVYVQIPMLGFTQSLNLSVSAGIAMHQLAARLRASELEWQLAEEEKTNLYIDWLSKSTPTGTVLLEKFIKLVAQE